MSKHQASRLAVSTSPLCRFTSSQALRAQLLQAREGAFGEAANASGGLHYEVGNMRGGYADYGAGANPQSRG